MEILDQGGALQNPVTTQEKPVIPQLESVPSTLQAAGVEESMVKGVEDVQKQSGMESEIRTAKDEIASEIERDIQERESLAKDRESKVGEMLTEADKLEELQEQQVLLKSYVAEARAQHQTYEDRLAKTEEELNGLNAEFQKRAEVIRAEQSAERSRIDDESQQERAGLRQMVKDRPETSYRERIVKDKKAIEDITKAMSDPNLAEALDRLAAVGGAQVDTVPLQYRVGVLTGTRDELAAEVAEKHKQIIDNAEALRKQVDLNAENDLKKLQEEYGQQKTTLEERITLYDYKASEFAEMDEKYSKELGGVEQAVGESTQRYEGLIDAVDQDNRRLLDLDRGISVQIRMIDSMNKALETNIQELSTKGNEVMAVVASRLEDLQNGFLDQVVERRHDLFESRGTEDKIINEELSRMETAVAEDAAKTEAKLVESLLATGLYEMAEGVIQKKAVRGVELIIADHSKQGEVDAVVEGYKAASQELDEAKAEYDKFVQNRRADIDQRYRQLFSELDQNTQAHDVRLNAAMASVEALQAALPPQPEAQANPGRVTNLLQSATRLFKTLFRK